MKKNYSYLFLFTFILLLGVNSCKKETKNPAPLPAKVADTKVTPVEINTWLDKMPQVKPSAALLAVAQTSIINGVQVVRIPVGYNAALYFTKENDSLKVYAYKWGYESLDPQRYTGYIDAYNFQTQNLNRLVYTNGTLTNTLLLAHYTDKATSISSNGQLKVSECWITSLFDAIWDWISGTFSGSGTAGGSSSGGDFSSYMNSSGYSASNYSGSGFTSGGGGGGGGVAWGPPPCPPTASQQTESTKLKVSKLDPNDPNNPPPAPGCIVVSNSQWLLYLIANDALKNYISPDSNLPVYLADDSHLHGQPLDNHNPSATYYSIYDTNNIIYNLSNESNGDPIELYLVANYKGSALLDLSQYSTTSNYHVGSYYLTPNFSNNGTLLFYSAWRNPTNGIEYLIQPSALSSFIINYKFYLAAANLVYLNGRPTDAMIKMMSGDYASGLQNMWGQALTDPAYLTNLAVAFVVGAAPAEQVTFISYENSTLPNSIPNFNIGMTLDDFKFSLARNTGQTWQSTSTAGVENLIKGDFVYTARTAANSNNGPSVNVLYRGALKVKYRLQ